MMPSPENGNGFASNQTSHTARSGTMWGLFGHGNINQEDNWEWKDELQNYKLQPQMREKELARHRRILQTNEIRGQGSFPSLESTYVRGMKDLEKTKMGTTSMGDYSHIESIKSRVERDPDPIRHDPAHIPRKPDSMRRSDYDPILQKYNDEIDQKKFSPRPGEEPIQPDSYAKLRERNVRTQMWMPGKPKGGRQYREKYNHESPIIGEPDEKYEEKTATKSTEWQTTLKDRFNPVFQVHGNAKSELRSQKEDREEKIKSFNVALNKRLVREGGYDPVTLRDRRTGERVGPLPDKQTEQKVSVATKHGYNARSGANVAYALGSERYGNPSQQAENESAEKFNIAQVDHVKEIMHNEGNVADGNHDLEMRTVEPTAAQTLMDDRYAHLYNADLFEPNMDNKQVVTSVNGGYGLDRLQKEERQKNRHYEPVLGVDDLVQDDCMTTWAPVTTLGENSIDPRQPREHPNPFTAAALLEQKAEIEREEEERARHQEDDTFSRRYEGKTYREPVRLWPEELKELSRRASDLEKAKKGI